MLFHTLRKGRYLRSIKLESGLPITLLALSDEQHDLLSIAERAKLPFHIVRDAALLLERQELLRAV